MGRELLGGLWRRMRARAGTYRSSNLPCSVHYVLGRLDITVPGVGRVGWVLAEVVVVVRIVEVVVVVGLVEVVVRVAK